MLSAALDGIPKIAERNSKRVSPSVRSPSIGGRGTKLSLQTARALGYDELDAQLWASTVMAQLQITEGIENLVGQIHERRTKFNTVASSGNRGAGEG